MFLRCVPTQPHISTEDGALLSKCKGSASLHVPVWLFYPVKNKTKTLVKAQQLYHNVLPIKRVWVFFKDCVMLQVLTQPVSPPFVTGSDSGAHRRAVERKGAALRQRV